MECEKPMTNLFKPIVTSVKTFDPSFAYTFEFSYDGNQSHSNRLIITDNASNKIVYDNKIDTMAWSQTLPAGKLTSNKQYTVQFQCFDVNGNASVISDKVYFFCLKTPTIVFSNLQNTIESSSYLFTANYSQSEGEMLKEYTFNLWGSTGKLVQTSGLIYAPARASEISYKFTALEDNNIYYIQITGTTVNGMAVTSEKLQFSVDYLRPSQYATFYTENDSKNALIRYSTNIIVIQYNGSEKFDYENGSILLQDQKIYYDSGFNLSGDFDIKIKGFGFQTGTEIFMAKNTDNNLTIQCVDTDDGNARFMLTVENTFSSYILFSSPIDLATMNMVTIVVRRINNLYLINAVADLGATNVADLYYGNIEPVGAANYSVYIFDDDFDTVKVDSSNVTTSFDKEAPKTPKNLDLWLQDTEGGIS